VGVKNNFFLKIHIDSGAHPASFSIDTAVPGVKRKGFEVDHSVPCTAEDKDEWSYNFTPHMCLRSMGRDATLRYRVAESLTRAVRRKNHPDTSK